MVQPDLSSIRKTPDKGRCRCLRRDFDPKTSSVIRNRSIQSTVGGLAVWTIPIDARYLSLRSALHLHHSNRGRLDITRSVVREAIAHQEDQRCVL